jgi:hypothetical protein
MDSTAPLMVAAAAVRLEHLVLGQAEQVAMVLWLLVIKQ